MIYADMPDEWKAHVELMGGTLRQYVPRLVKDTTGKELRASSGLMAFIGCECPASRPAVDAPIKFLCIFGASEYCAEAVRGLAAIGIKCKVRIPRVQVMEIDGREERVKHSSWRLSFELPYDWRMP